MSKSKKEVRSGPADRAEKPKKTEKPKKREPVYSVEGLCGLEQFRCRDYVLRAILDSDKKYTADQADKALTAFLRKKV